MAHDGFSLDDKRVAIDENDIPDVVNCWEKRTNKKFVESRKLRVDELRTLLAPLKDERRTMQAEINRLTFDHAVDSVSNGKSAADLSAAQTRLSNVESQISAPQSELDRLTRQFWVTKEQVKANKYDLSASRYRQVDADAVYHEKPSVTLERLARLESVMMNEITELKKLF
jgi:type I restriction enzyme M protein